MNNQYNQELIQLNVSNSTCRIENLTLEQFNRFKKLFSYVIPAAKYHGDHNQGIRYLLTKRGEFPTGLLDRFLEHCKAAKLPLQLRDTRKRPVGHPSASNKVSAVIKPYPTQLAAANACHKAHRGIIQMPTGSGKSIALALTIERLGVNTLVVVPSLELKRQLTATLISFFGKVKVGGFGKPIAVENVQALDTSRPHKGYDCVIIDEFHHSAATTYRTLNKKCWDGIYYRFGFTATPFRSQDEEQVVLESILSKVIYRLTYRDAVKAGFIVPVEAYYYELPKTEVDGYTWAQVYKELVTANKHRNDLIRTLMQSLRYAGKAALCLVKEIAHGEELAEGSLIPFAHGQNEETEELLKMFSTEPGCLIGTMGVVGEGVDTKPCEYVILAGLGKSRPALMQAFGRVMRRWEGKDTGKIILINDPSHKFTRSHFREQCKVLEQEYGIKPVKLVLD